LLKSAKLEERKQLSGSYVPALLPVESSQLAACFPETVQAGEALKIELKAAAFGETEEAPVLHYRHTNQNEGLFHTIKMSRSAGGYTAVIPAKYIIPDWDLQI
jgi:hypothetical protein